MKHRFRILFALVVFARSGLGQTALDPNEGSRLEHDPATGMFSLFWWGQPGRTYFLQHSDDLANWAYVPEIRSGEGAILGENFQTTADRSFFRLRSSDIPTTDPLAADFDGDKVGNMQELNNGTDPLHIADSDGDGLPDDWELAYGFDPNESHDALLDSDQDGWTNLSEWEDGTHPLDPYNGQRPPGVPVAPSEVISITNADGSIDLYWTDNSNNETYFVIRMPNGDGTWREVGRVGPGETHFRIPPP